MNSVIVKRDAIVTAYEAFLYNLPELPALLREHLRDELGCGPRGSIKVIDIFRDKSASTEDAYYAELAYDETGSHTDETCWGLFEVSL